MELGKPDDIPYPDMRPQSSCEGLGCSCIVQEGHLVSLTLHLARPSPPGLKMKMTDSEKAGGGFKKLEFSSP